MFHWLSRILGFDDLTGAWYGFWSGFGSDLGEFAIIGGLIQIVRHQNCHAKGCLRIGRHPVANTPFKTCVKHHPTVVKGTTAGQILLAHRQANDA